MNAMKFFVALFFLAACVLAIHAEEAEKAAQDAPVQAPAAPAEQNRQKRFPIAYPYYGLGYSAIHAPVAYHAPIATYHAPIAYHAPLAYSAYHYPAYSSYYHL